MLTYRLLEMNGDEYIYIFIILMEMKRHRGRSVYYKRGINGLNGYWKNLCMILEKDTQITL